MNGIGRLARGLRASLAQWLHQLNGEAAYANYLAHLRAHHPEATPLNRDEFHRREQQRRWDGVRRCC